MIFQEKQYTLNDGRCLTLRNATTEDAIDLIKYLKVTAKETPYLMRNPEEITITLEQEEHFIQSKIESERELMLIALVDGVHVGNCSLMTLGNYQRYAHRCDVAIALYQDYSGLGIGRILFQTVLAEAKKAGFEQVELEVISTNERAIHLYKSFGFEIYGTFPHNMKYQDGSYVNAYWMLKNLLDSSDHSIM